MVKELEDRGLVTKTAVDGKNYCSLIRLTEEGSGVAEQVNERYFERICGLIDKGKVRFGGRVNADEQQIEPTVMDNVTWYDAVMQEEIFCAVLLRQHRTKTIYNFCTHLACIFPVILHEFSLTYDSMSAENSYNLPKNLTAQYAHNLYAVLP